MSNPKSPLMVLAAGLSGLTQASAGTLSVNFVDDPFVDAMLPTDVAGMDLPGVRVSNWNNVQAAPAGPVDDPPVAWVLDNGTPVPGFSLEFQTNLDRWRLPADLYVDESSPGDDKMWKGYLDVAGGSSGEPGAIIEVSGIPFTGAYDLYIYFDGDNGGQWRKAVFEVSGPGIPEPLTEDGEDSENANWGTPGEENEAMVYQFPVPGGAGNNPWPIDGPNNDEGNVIRFSGLTGSSFTLKAWGGDNAGTPRAPINGFQIVESSDSDGDGLPNAWEVENGLNPNSAAGNDGANGDPDGDGVTNLQEYQRGSNPQLADTDGDGLPDGVETKTGVWVSASDTGTDPTKADSDGDGLSDAVETNTGVFVDENDTGTDPNKPDTDGDGLPDLWEVRNNLLASPPDGATGANGADGDPDGDGLNNAGEYAAGTDPHLADTDGDGLSDNQEVTIGSNPLVEDTDGDGLTDAEEVNGNPPTDPNSIDTDNDGLLDSMERSLNPPTDPTKADSDGDGVNDGLEVALQTNPLNPADVPNLNRTAISVNFEGLDSNAEVLNLLEPTDVAGLIPVRNWNNAYDATGLMTNLIDSTGASTSASIDWAGVAVWSWENSGDAVPATPNGTLFNGYLDSNDDASEHTITLTGIPYSSYDLIVYVDGENNGSSRPASLQLKQTGQEFYFDDIRNFDGTFAQAFGTDIDTATIAANFVIFNNLSSPTAALIGTARDFRIAINGLQIVARDASAPPPAGFRISTVTRNAETGAVTLTWESEPGAVYSVQASDSASSWTEVQGNIPSAGASTTFTESSPPAGARRFYRVVKQ